MTTVPTIALSTIAAEYSGGVEVYPPGVGVTVSHPTADTVTVYRSTVAEGKFRVLGGHNRPLAGTVFIPDMTVLYGAPTTYTAVATEAGVASAESAPTAPITVNTARIWLSDPQVEGSAVPVFSIADGDGWRDVQTWGSGSELVWPIGSPYGVGLYDVTREPSFNFKALAQSYDEKEALEEFFRYARTVLLRGPGSLREKGGFYFKTPPVVTRLRTQIEANDSWIFASNFTPTTPPLTFSDYVRPGERWIDMPTYYANWAAVPPVKGTWTNFEMDPKP